MSLKKQSFISIEDLKAKDQDVLFERTKKFKECDQSESSFETLVDFKKNQSKIVFLLFLEASTRTKLSFELACHKLGVTSITCDPEKSSMQKGESLQETLSTLLALKPSALILRHAFDQQALVKTSVPVINAGFGSYEHPSQALIDSFTILETRGKIKGEKVLIVGDILHSRVSNSNLKMLTKQGAEVAFCSPSSWRPKDENWNQAIAFKELKEGVKWASVIICLRIQKERHSQSVGLSISKYRDKYLLGPEHLELFNSKGMILHPGPHVCGIDISQEALDDPRCHIKHQVENSTYVRMALLSMILDLPIKK